jgi:hypothetical protein
MAKALNFDEDMDDAEPMPNYSMADKADDDGSLPDTQDDEDSPPENEDDEDYIEDVDLADVGTTAFAPSTRTNTSQDDMDFGDLEGYDALNDGSDNDEYNDAGLLFGTSTLAKKTRPAFYDRTTKNAERAAIRTQVTEADSFLLIEGQGGAPDPAPRVPGTFGRQRRVKGAPLAPYAKKITAELDSDDDLIMTMREKGYTDGQIADRLAKEGRVRYD